MTQQKEDLFIIVWRGIDAKTRESSDHWSHVSDVLHGAALAFRACGNREAAQDAEWLSDISLVRMEMAFGIYGAAA